jgi:hypothetical protein
MFYQRKQTFSKYFTILITRQMSFTGLIIVFRESSFDIATRYAVDGPGINYRPGEEIFRTSPDWLWGPTSLLYNGLLVPLTDVKAAGAYR